MQSLAHSRLVVILGNGARQMALLPFLNVPILTSWPAADLVDNDHPLYFGRPGVYGQRCANKVLAGATHVMPVGCRLSIWTVGHDFPRAGQQVVKSLDGVAVDHGWLDQCRAWRDAYPWIESPSHDDSGGYLNPHRFMARLQKHLKPDACIVADCATGSLAAHQILRLKPPQRLMTSGGLGEMGCGLPAAVGASFARGRGEVVCLTSDGGIMLTVQELATIAHHRLPVKIVVFCNDGYGMIKDTQRNLGYRTVGVNAASGVSFPDFLRLGESFGIPSAKAEKTAEVALRWLFMQEGPALLQVDIDPDYLWAPKLRPGKNADGSIKHADFAEMEPTI